MVRRGWEILADSFAKRKALAQQCAVPAGLVVFFGGVPALKRWAIFGKSLRDWTVGAGLVGRCARTLSPDDLAGADAQGYLPLRKALAGYLAVSRGVRCVPEQIIITGGFQGALGLVSRAFLSPGSPVVSGSCSIRAPSSTIRRTSWPILRSRFRRSGPYWRPGHRMLRRSLRAPRCGCQRASRLP